MRERKVEPDSAVVVEARRNGLVVSEMAERFKCSKDVINKVLRRAGATAYSADYDPTPEDFERMCKGHERDLRREHPNMEGVR